jgi:hypothetical protein
MRNIEKYPRNFSHKFLDVHIEKEWGTPRKWQSNGEENSDLKFGRYVIIRLDSRE